MHARVPFVQLSFAALTLVVGVFAVTTAAAQVPAAASFGGVRDPGVRQAATDGQPPPPLAGMTSDEMTFYQDGLARFQTVEVVTGAVPGQGNGLGPRFNSNSCSSCHGQPFVGGSSPIVNPLPAIAVEQGADNQVPWFITRNGPIREVRFVSSNGVPDGGVHDLWVISGRADAGSCKIAQPSFLPAGDPVSGLGGNRNIVFRIPTPIMGAGLIESIPDSTILAGVNANTTNKRQMGVGGHANAIQGGNVNRSGNDGTVTRFGWKAQNKSL
ncbi:MAG TPA: di-heme oxidoredictase family protein, partial [Steroidobacteraceae bacterium]|nr:di-heme oxidoredictase family protein [Steroidobacteraceae bacterium]